MATKYNHEDNNATFLAIRDLLTQESYPNAHGWEDRKQWIFTVSGFEMTRCDTGNSNCSGSATFTGEGLTYREALAAILKSNAERSHQQGPLKVGVISLIEKQLSVMQSNNLHSFADLQSLKPQHM